MYIVLHESQDTTEGIEKTQPESTRECRRHEKTVATARYDSKECMGNDCNGTFSKQTISTIRDLEKGV